MNLQRSVRRFLIWFGVVAVFGGGHRLQAGDEKGSIRGRISVPEPDRVTEDLLQSRSLSRYEMHIHNTQDFVPPYLLSEKAAVYIESVPDWKPSDDAPAVVPSLNQTQMLFRPLVLPILAGTTVSFPNGDNLFHNVFSYSQTRVFDLGRYPRGQTRTVRFDRPGVVKVYCDIHSYMYATILVLTNPYFTVPDDDGAYSIPGVPPGTYRLTLWYDRKKIATKAVTVEAGKAATVNFEY